MAKKKTTKTENKGGDRGNLSPEQKKEVDNTVETFVALYPIDHDATVARKVIEYLRLGDLVSHRSVVRRVKSARENLGKNLPQIVIEQELDKFMKTVLFTEQHLIDIVVNPLSKEGNRVQAAAQIVKGRKMIIDVMMDTGVIPRQLGTVNQRHAFLGALAISGDGKADLDKLRDNVSQALIDAGIMNPDGNPRTQTVVATEEENEQSD